MSSRPAALRPPAVLSLATVVFVALVLALPARAPARALAASEPADAAATTILKVRHRARVTLHLRPGGRRLAILGDRTEFGRRTILSVTARRGRWAAVATALVPNGKRAWVRVDRRLLAVRRTRWRLRADLTDRTLDLLHAGRLVRRFRVTIGARGTETPTGRSAITDKLAGRGFGAGFGCCILALAARQPKVRTLGLDGRMAIHGTDRPGLLGARGSLGCLRASDAALRALVRDAPVGTPVTIAT